MLPTLQTRLLRRLDLQGSPIGHLSAASGLLRVGERLYVVADDELGIGVFDLHGNAPGTLVALAPGALPDEHAARKAAKPDCEALALLPAGPGWPHGALLALGSGSRPTRARGFLLALDAAGQVAGAARRVDLAPLYEALRPLLGELNVEGAFVAGDGLTLLQRGNRSHRRNTSIRLDVAEFAAWLAGTGAAPAVRGATQFELGDIDGVPLTFTDGAALDSGRWIFSAAAEDTSDSYSDGACLGSIIGVVDQASGRVVQQLRLDRPCKVEGLALASGGGRELLLVTDADDRREAAALLACTLPVPAH